MLDLVIEGRRRDLGGGLEVGRVAKTTRAAWLATRAGKRTPAEQNELFDWWLLGMDSAYQSLAGLSGWPAACRSGNGSVTMLLLPGVDHSYQCAPTMPGQREDKRHDLRPLPGAPPRGLPGRNLVRLPAPFPARGHRTGAGLDPPGLIRQRAE